MQYVWAIIVYHDFDEHHLEACNGIQALDLLGRKVLGIGGVSLSVFANEIRGYAENSASRYSHQLLAALQRLLDVSDWLADQATLDASVISSSCVEYLHLFGYVSYAYLWTRMAEIAEEKCAVDETFYGAKRATAEFFLARLLPRVESLDSCIRNGSASLYALTAEQF